MTKTIYDAHCHLFYKGYITRRILHALLELMSDLDKIITQDKTKNSKNNNQKLKISSLIRRTINVINLIMTDSSEQVMLKLDKKYKDLDVIFVPLAYDVTSCFRQAYDQDITTLATRKERDMLDQIMSNMLLILNRYVHKLTKYKILPQLSTLYSKLEELAASRQDNTSSQQADIFMFQINQLIDLKKKYPQRVYPFLYVDPRRKNTLSLAQQIVGPDKPFLGIKLYTPNGYSPLDPGLMDLYAFCEQNNIPITVHNSYGGFATFVKKLEIKGGFYRDGRIIEHNGWIEFDTEFFSSPGPAILERANALNHPLIWQKVLEHFPLLRLNLAHFGGDGLHWQQPILKLMLQYPNVYTDLSCQTETQMLMHIKQNYFHLAKDKFIYGSDYYLNMFFIDTFDQYLSNFFSVFSENDLDQIMFHNPKRFLFGSNRETVA